MKSRNAFVVVCVMLAALSASAFSLFSSAPPREDTADQVIRNALGSVAETMTWTETVGNTMEDLWDSANLPQGLDSMSERSRIQWLYIEHCDVTHSTVPVCVEFGAGNARKFEGVSRADDDVRAVTSPISCVAGAFTAKPLMQEGRGFTVKYRPDSGMTINGSGPAAATVWYTPHLWAISQTGNVDVCVTAVLDRSGQPR